MEEHVGIRGDLAFEEWIAHIFDHQDPDWHWGIEAPYWNPAVDPARTLSFLGLFFSSPSFLIEAACLDAMERTLAIDHVACQEGALHGLGHWADGYPERVRGIIDAYLHGPSPHRGLLEYAKAARKGDVQ